MGKELKTLVICAIALLDLVSGVRVTHALEFRVANGPRGAQIAATGDIARGDADRLKIALARTKDAPAYVSLNSPGGNLQAGLELGRLIRQRNLATLVERRAICTSACALAFAGGVLREIEPGAKIGVHMASLMFGDAYIAKMRELLLNTAELSLNERLQLIVALNEQFSAQAMSDQAQFLQEMGVSLRLLFQISNTRHWDMTYLTTAQMRELNLVNAQ